MDGRILLAGGRRRAHTFAALVALVVLATGARAGSLVAQAADAPACPVDDPTVGQVVTATAAELQSGDAPDAGQSACEPPAAAPDPAPSTEPAPDEQPPPDPNSQPPAADPQPQQPAEAAPADQQPQSADDPQAHAAPATDATAGGTPAPQGEQHPAGPAGTGKPGGRESAAGAPADAPPKTAPPASLLPTGRTHTIRTRRHRSAQHNRPEAQVFFPPVSVDWSAISPLAPPRFGADEAARYPGPAFLLPIYEAAAAQYNVPWQILAAINEVETDFGRNTSTSSAGAVGWMQFLPSTWAEWGVDANGDGVKNPQDPVDAIFAAARYLKASGSLHDIGGAVYAYNHAGWYVDRVVERALDFAMIPTDLLTALSVKGRSEAGAISRARGSTGYLAPHADVHTIGQIMLLDDEALQRRVLADERVHVYECGRADIAAGVVDRRVLETLEFLAHRRLEPTVTSLRCGHGYYTSSGNVSEHSSGGAVDISAINGTPILGNQGSGSITESAITLLLRLQGGMRPHQIISLMTFDGAPNTLALGDHDDHIHVGFAPVRAIEGR